MPETFSIMSSWIPTMKSARETQFFNIFPYPCSTPCMCFLTEIKFRLWFKNLCYLSVLVDIKPAADVTTHQHSLLLAQTPFSAATIIERDLYFVLSGESSAPAVSNLSSTLPPTSVSTALPLLCRLWSSN